MTNVNSASSTQTQLAAHNTVRALMLLVLLGLVVVIISLLFMHWPSATTSDVSATVIHPLRVIDRLASGGSAALPGLVLDIGVYAAIIVGLSLMAFAGLRGARRPLPGLMMIGLLGLAYAGGMVLYNGPMISICGFTLILFGGTVAWIASTPDDAVVDETAAYKSTPVPSVNAVEAVEAQPISSAAMPEPVSNAESDIVPDVESEESQIESSIESSEPLDELPDAE